MRAINQCLAGLQHQAQQPRLLTETNVKIDIKSRKHMECAAANGIKHGYTSFARVDHDPMRQTSFGDDFTESPALICRDDALVDEGAEAPKPCLLRGEMRQHPPLAYCSPAQPLQR